MFDAGHSFDALIPKSHIQINGESVCCTHRRTDGPDGAKLMSKTQKQYGIFVVDDEPTISSTLGLILSQQGFDVTTFTDPLEALKALQTKAPDLIIADVIMPGLSGIDLAIVIRETCPDCTVLLFSGQIATHEMIEGAKARGHVERGDTGDIRKLFDRN